MHSAKILLILYIMMMSSCISRLGRPSLMGVVADFDGNPIKNCTVGDVLTNKNGYFKLSELRYNQFLLTEIFQMEAPPLMVSEQISKSGFTDKEIYAFSTFGGGGGKGSTWNLDTIYLKREDQNPNNLIPGKWNVSANEKMDTLFLIKERFHELCRTRDCKSFYYEYDSYSDNYLDSQGKNNLPENVIRKQIVITFKTNQSLEGKRIIQYGNKDGSWSDSAPNDTTHTHGKWHFFKNNLLIESEFEEFKGPYNLVKFDYEYMMWVKMPVRND